VISIDAGFISTAKMIDLSVVSGCLLGFSGSELTGSGLSGVLVGGAFGLPGLPTRERPVLARNERPTEAREAVVATAQAKAYAFAATGAEAKKQTQHHTMWAFRGLEPWSDPA
jgi:hypothetical protein